MLPYAIRKALFFLFVGIFFVSAPLVVLYTAGYRFNRGNNTVSQTGTLAIASTPKGADIVINNEMLNDTTPAVLQRLSLGTRTVHIEKEGYHTWERTANVQSGATTYITAPLFLDELPVLLAQGGTDWERAQTAHAAKITELPDTILFTPSSAGIEVYKTSLTGSTFITLLQKDTYTPLAADRENLFVKNSKGELFFIALSSSQAAQSLGKDAVAFAWDAHEQLFAWSDGLEVHLFHPATRMQELITRQSDAITALTFAHSGESIVLASIMGLTGIDLLAYTDGRMQTSLLSFDEPTTVWFSEDGSIAYLETAQNLSSLAITP